MKMKPLLLLSLLICRMGEATAQTTLGSPPNMDPDRLRAIVQAEAEKARSKAVLFGMWVHDREVLTWLWATR